MLLLVGRARGDEASGLREGSETSLGEAGNAGLQKNLK